MDGVLERSSKKMMKGAAILTLAAFFSKILSVLYRVPFQNIVGDTGFYIYQQVYPLYGILLALCTYAFPVMISKLVAERMEKGEIEAARRVVHVSFFYLTIVGTGLFLLIRLGSAPLAGWMGDEALAPLIALTAYPFLLLPVLSTTKGWFQAQHRMVPSAISQGVEQLVRVIVILAASFSLMAAGASLYTVGYGAVSGSVAGALAGVLLLIFFVRKENVPVRSFLHFRLQASDWSVVRQLTLMGTAIGMGSMMLVLYQLMDALNVYASLVAGGVPEEAAKAMKGMYDRGQPLIQMGIVVATSLSLAVVPMVAAAHERGETALVRKNATLSLKVSVLFGAAAAVGLANVMIPLNRMLFQDAEGSAVLMIFVFAVFFASVILTISSVLQGMGSYHVIAWTIVASLLVKYALNGWLVPVWGTMGASVATCVSLSLVMLLAIFKLRKAIGPLVPIHFYRRLFVGLVAMTVGLQLYLLLWTLLLPEVYEGRIGSAISAVSGAILGGFLFFYVIWGQGLFTDEETKQMPLGSKLDRFFGRRVREKRG